jgi:tetratricopeptide (TPR) repeat protein
MHSIFAYAAAAALGVLIAHFISRAPELRTMRLSQLVFVPLGMVLGVYFLPDGSGSSGSGDIAGFVCCLVAVGFLLRPNIAYHCGAGLSNFLDPPDWTPAEEEIALRPIRRMIDEDEYTQALADLDELLKKHPPTYEAILIKTKLLYHFGSVDETVATLLGLIGLSKTTAQQLAVMELLAVLENHHRTQPKPLTRGVWRIQIDHELILYPIAGDDPALHQEIPPGEYEVEQTFHRNHHWLKLAGEDWGNAEMCWEAIRAVPRAAAGPPKKGLLRKIVRLHETVAVALKGKPRIQQQADAQKLYREASQFIRAGDWPGAVPLLQKASALDPDRYEFAYRWVQAVRQTAGDAATAQAVSQALQQSQWTESEQQMLLQLKRPLGK